jgi:hypothetical protein
MPHNFFYLRQWLAANFYHNHVLEVAADDPEAKKRAEILFQKRGKATNTLLCLGAGDASRLLSEVIQRQGEYKAEPNKLYWTRDQYPYYERGGEGAEKKRARFKGFAYMQYAVRNECRLGVYKINHLELMAPTPTADVEEP